MRVYTNIGDFSFKHPVATLGIFDGVHLGHKEILSRLVEAASAREGESVVITLWPHPRKVLYQKYDELKFITSLEEKKKVLAGQGVDNLVIIPFTREFSKLSSCAFIEKILAEKLKVEHLVMGYNHHFGHDREGDLMKLRACADPFGITIEQLQPQLVGERKVSSSMVRSALQKGKIELANTLLGHAFFTDGKITGGFHVGRKIGFPTANIAIEDPDKLLPPDGVYAVKVNLEEKQYNGMLNIGFRPTLKYEDPQRTVEVHIIGFEGDVYDKPISVSFIKRLRDEIKFNTVDELIRQLKNDREETLKILNNI